MRAPITLVCALLAAAPAVAEEDVLKRPEVLELRADLAEDLLRIEPGLGGGAFKRSGQAFSDLAEAVEPSAAAVKLAREAENYSIAGLVLSAVSGLAIGGALSFGLQNGSSGLLVAGGAVGTISLVGSTVLAFYGQQSFWDAINTYNEELLRGQLDRDRVEVSGVP